MKLLPPWIVIPELLDDLLGRTVRRILNDPARSSIDDYVAVVENLDAR